tara:strand:- start:186 stop:338 length:153 start_codon:yes stop_codon:yes gene_type:complete
MMNAYGFDEKIHFPNNPYDGYIYLDQYQCCWEYQEDTNKWINLDATSGED